MRTSISEILVAIAASSTYCEWWINSISLFSILLDAFLMQWSTMRLIMRHDSACPWGNEFLDVYSGDEYVPSQTTIISFIILAQI